MSALSPVYRAVMTLATPAVRWWGRLAVVGEDLVPAEGPVLVMANHDSAWDPVVVGVALIRRRQVRALAKDSLWRVRPVAWVLDRMGQIPIARGRGDTAAMADAIRVLAEGGCVGVFPEGTVSRGRTLRPMSGAGRVALAVPGAPVLAVRITGAVDLVRFPRRPRVRVEVFEPAGGPPAAGESAVRLTRRVVEEIRQGTPPVIPGRPRAAAGFRRLVAEHEARTGSGSGAGGAAAG